MALTFIPLSKSTTLHDLFKKYCGIFHFDFPWTESLFQVVDDSISSVHMH